MFLQHLSNNTLFSKKHRGIGQIIGSLLLLAIVVPIGSVILINGTTEINNFNNELSTSVVFNNQGVKEDIVFEHVRFDPPTEKVTITLRNTGSINSVIDRIMLINMTNQEVLYKIDGVSVFSPTLTIKNSTDIDFNADLGGGMWNNTSTDLDYKISIITARGNFYDTIVRTFNT